MYNICICITINIYKYLYLPLQINKSYNVYYKKLYGYINIKLTILLFLKNYCTNITIFTRNIINL